MAEMARFIKPILSIVPPDPGKLNPMDWLPFAGLAKGFKDLPTRLQTTFIQLMTMSAADFLDQWFETEPLKATMSASGIIGTFQGPRSPGTAYVLLHHYMGEIDGAFRAWGIPKGGTGGVSNAIASAALSLGRRDPHRGIGRAHRRRRRPDDRRHARERRDDPGRRGAVVGRLEPDVPQAAGARARSTRTSKPRCGATSTAARAAR